MGLGCYGPVRWEVVCHQHSYVNQGDNDNEEDDDITEEKNVKAEQK